ncbi:Major facilitator superfamily MFS-1 domain containing protein [Aphelenchoides fujianensis]|nr:Major facilitator superfamily MFS-1 domain containing protein [Aphelenchoides fujianensis]
MTAHSSRSNSTVSPPPTTSFWLQARRSMAGWQIRAEVKMRRVYELPSHVANDTKEADKFFNRHMIEWDQNYAYVNVPLACLMTIVLGAYSDRNGRKPSMLVGLLGMLLGNAVYILVWWKRTNLQLEFVFLAAVLDGLCGGFRLVISAVNAFLSDQFEAKRTQLSIRMIVTYTLLNVGDLLGSQLTNAAILLGSNEVVVMLIVECILVLTIVYVLFVIHDFVPLERQEEGNDGRNSFRVLVRKRPDSRRLLLLLILFCAFINRLAFSEEKSLIGTYTKLPPFEWTTRDYATYKTVRPFLQIIGLLFGLFVLKGWLRLRDSLILLIATFSMGLDALLIGLAWNSALIYASLSVGFMHALVNPLSYTVLSCVAETKEMGRVYAVDTVVDNLALFLRTAILQSVYTATVDWHQASAKKMD